MCWVGEIWCLLRKKNENLEVEGSEGYCNLAMFALWAIEVGLNIDTCIWIWYPRPAKITPRECAWIKFTWAKADSNLPTYFWMEAICLTWSSVDKRSFLQP